MSTKKKVPPCEVCVIQFGLEGLPPGFHDALNPNAEEQHRRIADALARERERAENEHEMLKEQIDLVHRLQNAIQDVLKLAQTGTPERTWLIARLKESER